MQKNNRALVAAFDDRLQGEQAVRDFEAAGFLPDQIGFVIRGFDAVRGGMITDATGTKDAKGAVVGASTGAIAGGLIGAAATLALPGVGPIISAGIFSAIFGGAAAGTAVGGILGAMTGLAISEEEARFYDEKFRTGKAIVVVHPRDRATEAQAILRRHGGYDVHFQKADPVPTGETFSTP